MRNLLKFFLLLFILLSTPATAGVVEDAEEELRKLREAQGQGQTVPGHSPPPFQNRPSSSPARPGPNTAARPADTAFSPTTTAPTTTAVTEHRAAKQNAKTEVEELSRRPREITHEDKKGYFFSFLIILVFAVLIALASLFGRRVETEE